MVASEEGMLVGGADVVATEGAGFDFFTVRGFWLRKPLAHPPPKPLLAPLGSGFEFFVQRSPPLLPRMVDMRCRAAATVASAASSSSRRANSSNRATSLE